MMNRFTSWLSPLMVVCGVMFSACGDDPVAPAEPTGNSTVTVMHANPGITSDVLFKLDTMTLARLGFSATGTASVRNGNRKIDVRATDGSHLATADIPLDTTVSVWVIFSGTLVQKDAFRVSTKKITPSAGNAAVRVVHASHGDLGPISVKINDLTGLSFTQNAIAYKGSSDYVSLPVVSTTQLVITKTNAASEVVLNIPITGNIEAGKSYTVVLYGSSDPNADPSVKLTSKIVAD